jgi:hypothetical protein
VSGTVVYRIATQTWSSLIVAFCEGPVIGGRRFWISSNYYPSIASLNRGGYIGGGHTVSDLTVFKVGTRPTQTQWGWLPYLPLPGGAPDALLTYPGVAIWCADARQIPAGSAETYELEMDGFLSTAADADPVTGDAHPASIIADSTYGLLPSTIGAGFSWPVVTDIGPDGTSGSSARQYWSAAGIRLSPVIDQKRKAVDILDELLASTNASCRMSDGTLEIIPLGDISFIGNSLTYTPDVAIRYALDESDFKSNGGSEDPVQVKRTAREEVFNITPVEFTERDPTPANPTNAYVTRTVEDPDPVDVALNGTRRQGAVSMRMICLPTVAQRMSRLRAQRAVKRRNTYTFKIHALNYGLLEPLDYLSLSDSRFGLSGQVVRIQSIEEDESGVMTVEAADAPLGMSHAAENVVQSSESGFVGRPWISPVAMSHQLAMKNWTARTIPSGTYNAVTWSQDLGLFCAVGSSACATSPDGITWTSRTIPAGTYKAVAWNGSLFAAVGDSGLCSTSSNGTSWTSRTIPAGYYTALTWNGSVFVAVTSNLPSNCATSSDGVTWSAHSMPDHSYYGVAWTGSLFVAVGAGSGTACATSPDGSTWTQRSIPGGTYFAVAWNGSNLAAVGNVNATSPDGITWTAREFPVTPGVGRVLSAVTWTGYTFVAVEATNGATAVCYVSTDGVNWIPNANAMPVPAGAGWLSVAWSGYVGCAVAQNGAVTSLAV